MSKGNKPAPAKPLKHAVVKKKVPHATVNAAMNVLEVIGLHPGAADILSEYGLHCHNCAFNTMDSLDAGARTHGLEDADIENLIDDLNDLLKTAPTRPATLTITASAAQSLSSIAEQEKKVDHIIRVMTDEAGGFCMEFMKKAEKEDTIFKTAIKTLIVAASPETLARIGGSTIDFREGRFKLDVWGRGCGCLGGEDCSCKE